MATIPEAREMGFTFPGGDDLISKGDDAIQTNALAAATGIKAARYARGNHPPADWNTIRTPGAYNFGSPFPNDGSTNFPPDAETALTLIVTTPAGTWGVQEAYQFGPRPRRWWRTARTSVVWNDWIELGGAAGLSGGAMASHSMWETEFINAMGGPIDTGGLGAISIRCDHGLTNIKASLIEAFRSRGIVPVIAMNSRNWGIAENSGATQSEVNAWVEAGEVEIWNHSATHGDAYDEATLVDEIVNGRLELEQQLPAAAPVWGFAPPGTQDGWLGFGPTPNSPEKWGTTAGQLILAHHAYAAGYIGNAYRPLTGQIQQGVPHISLDTYSMSAARTAIDRAAADRTGLQLMMHPRELDKAGKMTTAQFISLLDYIVAKREAGELVTLSPNEMLLADATRPPVTVPDVTGLAARLAALEQDTGDRDITSLVPNLVAGSGHWTIRRTGGWVYMNLYSLTFTPTSGSLWQQNGFIPVGFRPVFASRYVRFPASPSSTSESPGPFRADRYGGVTIYNAGQGAVHVTASWPTNDAFPTTLPGDPA